MTTVIFHSGFLFCTGLWSIGDEKVNRAIDDVRTAEAEKLGNAIADERQRADRLEVTVQQLRQVILARTEAGFSQVK